MIVKFLFHVKAYATSCYLKKKADLDGKDVGTCKCARFARLTDVIRLNLNYISKVNVRVQGNMDRDEILLWGSVLFVVCCCAWSYDLVLFCLLAVPPRLTGRPIYILKIRLYCRRGFYPAVNLNTLQKHLSWEGELHLECVKALYFPEKLDKILKSP